MSRVQVSSVAAHTAPVRVAQSSDGSRRASSARHTRGSSCSGEGHPAGRGEVLQHSPKRVQRASSVATHAAVAVTVVHASGGGVGTGPHAAIAASTRTTVVRMASTVQLVETAIAIAGRRTSYRWDVWATLEGLERCVLTLTGEGPLGRLRALARLEVLGYDLRALEAPRGAGAIAWEWTAARRRLRAEGIL